MCNIQWGTFKCNDCVNIATLHGIFNVHRWSSSEFSTRKWKIITLTSVGFEPATFGLLVQRSNHWATRPDGITRKNFIYERSIYLRCNIPTIVRFEYLKNGGMEGTSIWFRNIHTRTVRPRSSVVRALNYSSNPKVVGSIPTEVRVMIFRSLGEEKLGRSSSMNKQWGSYYA